MQWSVISKILKSAYHVFILTFGHYYGRVIFQSVFKSKAFQELSEDALAEVLKDNGLNMDESEILKYIKEWAAVNSVSWMEVWSIIMILGFHKDIP